MRGRNIALLARKEVSDAVRNKWFVLYAVAFALLATGLARMALDAGATAGFAGFGRTTASLVNLVLLIVPIMGLTLGAASIAADRERGTLASLMAQPVAPTELLLGKFLGLALALTAAICFGFGVSGLVVAAGAGAVGAGTYLFLVAVAAALGLAMIAVGLFLSVFAGSAGAAMGAALFTWLCLVLLGDLGLMGTAVTVQMPTSVLFGLAALNPVESTKILALHALTGSLDLLGPAGAYAVQAYGRSLPLLLGAILVAWCVIPLAGAGWALPRKGYL